MTPRTSHYFAAATTIGSPRDKFNEEATKFRAHEKVSAPIEGFLIRLNELFTLTSVQFCDPLVHREISKFLRIKLIGTFWAQANRDCHHEKRESEVGRANTATSRTGIAWRLASVTRLEL